MTIRPMVKLGGQMFGRAGWAPTLVFLLHVFVSRFLNGYILYPPIDIPMHFFGGVAMAYFLSARSRLFRLTQCAPTSDRSRNGWPSSA